MADVRLFQTNDGGEVAFVAGQPAMDGGLETSAFLSMFGGNERDPGLAGDSTLEWWGNKGESLAARKYRSETQHLLASLPVTPANIKRVEDAGARDLDWMVAELEATVAVSVSIPALNKWQIGVSIEVGSRKYELAFERVGGVQPRTPDLLVPTYASFSPLVIPGCVLYLDPRDPDAITLTDASLVAGDDFSNAAWTKTATVTANDDGIGDRITTTTGSGTQFVDQNPADVGLNSTACPPIRFTWRFKPGTTTWVMLDHATGTTRTIWFNLATGTQGTKPAQITNVSISAPDANGYRTYSYDVIATNGALGCTFRGTGGDNATTNPGNGTYFWAQSVAISQARVSAIDNIGSGVSWAQASASLQLGYDATGLNGKPCLTSFGGQYIESSEAAVLNAAGGNDQPSTIFMVAKGNGTLASADCLIGWSGSGSAQYSILRDNGGIGPLAVSKRGDADGAGVQRTSATWGLSNISAGGIVEVWNAGTVVSLAVNGGTANPSSAALDLGTLTPTGCRLLGRAVGSVTAIAALGPVAVYNRALTAEERSYIRRGLGMAYGIAVAA